MVRWRKVLRERTATYIYQGLGIRVRNAKGLTPIG